MGTYITDLTVIAGDEDDARELTLRFLRELHDGQKTIKIQVEAARRAPEQSDGPRARGVASVDDMR